MSLAKDTLVRNVFDIVKTGGTAAIYFGPHVMAVTKAKKASGMEGVLVCQGVQDEPIVIEIEAIVAVRNVAPIDDI